MIQRRRDVIESKDRPDVKESSVEHDFCSAVELIGAFQQITLDTVFSELGLDAPNRRKDRTNVQVVVTGTVGNATVAATTVAIDNASGDTKTFPLLPTAGAGTPNITFTAPVLTQPQSPGSTRRRAAKH